MDMFYEKIVRRRKSMLDIAYSSFIVTVAIILSYLAFLFLTRFSPIIILGIGYLAWFLATKRNIEYEYVVTNGDIDIDVIINQRKRKRVFSANCKNFEVLAGVNSDQYTPQIRSMKTVEDYSSRNLEADVWFIRLNHNGVDKVILFEPDERMVDCFRTFIPRKVFKS
jgi:hypothetical protein